LGIATCFEILSFNGFSAPGTRRHRARLVAMSSSSDKLASGDAMGGFARWSHCRALLFNS
jgi:hypothetical protein